MGMGNIKCYCQAQARARLVKIARRIKPHEGPELTETGTLEDLSRMETSLAWLLLKQLAPATTGFVVQLKVQPAAPL